MSVDNQTTDDDRVLTANGEPATIRQTTETTNETYLELEHRETGELLGTVAESDIKGN